MQITRKCRWLTALAAGQYLQTDPRYLSCRYMTVHIYNLQVWNVPDLFKMVHIEQDFS